MTVLHSGATKAYADNFSKAFGKSKKKDASAKKKSAGKKTKGKKSGKK